MGLFGKSKKEIEQEKLEFEDAKIFEDNYGITKLHFEGLTKGLRCAYSTDNIDAIIRLKAPHFYDTINDIYRASMHNQEQLDRLEKKYYLLLEAINKQNELLSAVLNSNSANQPSYTRKM